MTAAVTSLLSVRQRRILDFVRQHHTDRGYAPSLRDIGVQVGLSSVSAVRYQVLELEGRGWIRRTPGVSRTLIVLNPADGTDS